MGIYSAAAVCAVLIAVSGAASAEDKPGGPKGLYFDSKQIATFFPKGGSLTDQPGQHFRVRAGSRTKPGFVEVHEHASDVMYIVSGAATFVTGGTVTDAKPVGPDGVIGKTIVGGDERQLHPGDVVVLFPGTDHWFKEVSGQISFVVVHME